MIVSAQYSIGGERPSKSSFGAATEQGSGEWRDVGEVHRAAVSASGGSACGGVEVGEVCGRGVGCGTGFQPVRFIVSLTGWKPVPQGLDVAAVDAAVGVHVAGPTPSTVTSRNV